MHDLNALLFLFSFWCEGLVSWHLTRSRNTLQLTYMEWYTFRKHRPFEANGRFIITLNKSFTGGIELLIAEQELRHSYPVANRASEVHIAGRFHYMLVQRYIYKLYPVSIQRPNTV